MFLIHLKLSSFLLLLKSLVLLLQLLQVCFLRS